MKSQAINRRSRKITVGDQPRLILFYLMQFNFIRSGDKHDNDTNMWSRKNLQIDKLITQ